MISEESNESSPIGLDFPVEWEGMQMNLCDWVLQSRFVNVLSRDKYSSHSLAELAIESDGNGENCWSCIVWDRYRMCVQMSIDKYFTQHGISSGVRVIIDA